MHKIKVLVLLFTASSIVYSCKRKQESSLSGISDDPISKLDPSYLNRISKVLRNGKRITSDELRKNSLSNKNLDDYISYLMNQPEFTDATLDFFLYFLGLKQNDLLSESPEETKLDADVKAHPLAVTAALEIKQNSKTFDNIFSLYHPKYMEKINWDEKVTVGFNSDESEVNLKKYTGLETKEKVLQGTKREIIKIASLYLSNEVKEVKILAMDGLKKENCTKLTELFGSSAASNLLESVVGSEMSDTILRRYNEGLACSPFMGLTFPMKDFIEEIETTEQTFNWFVSTIVDNDRFSFTGTKARHWSENLAGFDKSSFTEHLSQEFLIFSPDFWIDATNSSTNFNRKRASYVLKTFFCDDLTPINVETIANGDGQHKKNKHASDPSCQACHYKLDPMAGFFKDHGILGVSFEPNSSSLIAKIVNSKGEKLGYLFDDFVSLNPKQYQEYLENWKDSRRKDNNGYNIGYIRSVSDHNANDYGQNLGDLMKIMRRSREVNQCIVQKLAKYVLGENQATDRAWIESLGDELDYSENKSTTFKAILASLLKSNTFSLAQKNTEKCYDRLSDTGLPCQIAYVIEENCVMCHYGGDTSGNLNLEEWISKDNGMFPHLAEDGRTQLSKIESFNRIKARISSDDLDKRMPLDMEMSSKHREILYLWVSDELSK